MHKHSLISETKDSVGVNMMINRDGVCDIGHMMMTQMVLMGEVRYGKNI